MSDIHQKILDGINKLNGRFDHLESQVDNLENKVDNLENKVEQEFKQIHTAIDDLNRIQMDIVSKLDLIFADNKNNRLHIEKIEDEINFTEVVKEERELY